MNLPCFAAGKPHTPRPMSNSRWHELSTARPDLMSRQSLVSAFDDMLLELRRLWDEVAALEKRVETGDDDLKCEISDLEEEVDNLRDELDRERRSKGGKSG